MRRKVLIILAAAVAVFALLLAGAGLWWMNNSQTVLAQLEQTLTQELTQTLGTQVKLEQLKLDGLKTVLIDKFTVMDSDGKVMISVDEVSVGFSLWSFLKSGKPVAMVDSVVLKNPHLFLRQNPDSRWNVQNLNIKESGGEDNFTGKVIIDKGKITVSTLQGEWEGENLSGQADCSEWPKIQVKLAFTHLESPAEEPAKESKSQVEGFIDTKTNQMSFAVKTPHVYLPNYQKFIPADIPLTFEAGEITDIDIEVANESKIFEFKNLKYKGEFKLDDVAVEVNAADFGIEQARLDKARAWITFNNEYVYILDSAASVIGQPLAVKGRIGLTGEQPVFELNAASPGVDLKAISAIIPDLAVRLEGEAAFTAAINGTLQNPKFDAEIKWNKGKWENFSIDQTEAVVNYQDNILNVKKAAIKIFGGDLELLGSVDIEKQNYQLELFGQSLDLSELAAGAGYKDAGGGLAQVILAAKGSLKNLNATELAGQISVDSGHISGVAFEKFYGTIQGTDGLFKLDRASLTMSGGAFINAEGKMENGDLDLTIKGEQIKIGDLTLAQIKENEVNGTVAFEGKVIGDILSPEASISFKIDDFLAKGINYGKSYGKLKVNRQQLILEEMTVREYEDFNYLTNDFLAKGVSYRQSYGKLEVTHHPLVLLKKTPEKERRGYHYLTGSISLDFDNPVFNITATTSGIRAETIAALVAPEYKLTGLLDHQVTISGTLENFSAKGWVNLSKGSFQDHLIDEVKGDYEYKDKTLYVDSLTARSIGSKISLIGLIKPDNSLDFHIHANEISLARMPIEYPYPVSGWIDIIGKISGTLDDPLIDGKMTATRIRANGQILTDLSGAFSYRQDILNIGKLSVRQGEGEVSFKGAANIKTMNLEGSLNVDSASIPMLLALAKQGNNNNIDGFLNGNILVSGTIDKPAVILSGNITGGRVKQYELGSVEMRASFINDVITIIKLKAEQGDGILAAQGTADLNGDIQMEIAGQNLNAGLFTAFVDSPFNLEGKVKFTAQASGLTRKPQIAMSLEVDGQGVEGSGFDTIYGLFAVKDEVVNIEQLYAQKDSYRASAQGTLPLKAINPDGRKSSGDSDQMDITLKLDNADLSILPLLFKEVQWASGATTGQIELTGTLKTPKAKGKISVPEGRLKLTDFADPVEKIEVNIVFEDNTVTIDKFSGQMRERPYNLTGTAALDFSSEELWLANYNFSLIADKLSVRHKYFNGLIDANLVLNNKGRKGRPLISGNIYTENSTIEIPGLPSEQSSGLNIEMDIQVDVGPKVRLYNPYLFDILAEGKVNFAGTLKKPALSGHVKSHKGSIRYLTTTFNIVNASADFMPHEGVIPNVNLQTKARVGRTVVMLNVNGLATDMQMRLTSDPPMSRENIIKLLTFGSGGSASDENYGSYGNTTPQIYGFLSLGLQMQAVAQAENILRKSVGIDEFRLEPMSMFEYRGRRGRSDRNSDHYGYSLRIGKYIWDGFMVSYVNGLSNGDHGVTLQYELNRQLSVSATYGGMNNGLYVVEGRFRF